MIVKLGSRFPCVTCLTFVTGVPPMLRALVKKGCKLYADNKCNRNIISHLCEIDIDTVHISKINMFWFDTMLLSR